MKKIEKINFGDQNVDIIKSTVEKNYIDLINDYKKFYKKKEIIKSFLAQRIFARFLSFRSLNPEILKPLTLKIKDKFKKQIYLAPYLYVRHCKYNKFINSEHKKALLFTEPHYDKYTFKNKGYTFWIPLHNSNKNTGTLCYIKKNKSIEEYFPINGKNKFNIANYVLNHKTVEKLIKKNVFPVNCNYGSGLYFNQDILHGAIHANKNNRTSINFQVSYTNLKNIKKNKKFYISNFYLEEKNILNLMYHGDFVYYYKNKNKINEIFSNKKLPYYLVDKFKILKKKIKKKKLNLLKDIHYSKEDSWLI